MKKIFIFLATLLTTAQLYACTPIPGAIQAEAMSPEERSVLISEYKEKISSRGNLFERPTPTWTNQVPKYQMIRDSGLYTLFITERSSCLSRGLYIKNWLAFIIFGLVSVLTFFTLRAGVSLLAKKRELPLFKSLVYYSVLFTVAVLLVFPELRLYLRDFRFYEGFGSSGYGLHFGRMLYASILALTLILSLGEKNLDVDTKSNDGSSSLKRTISLFLFVILFFFAFFLTPLSLFMIF